MLPKHIINKDESVFKIVTRDTYHGMMSKAVTDMLVTHNVVITSNTHENLAFDEDTLLRIAPLDRPIGVHDLSEPALIQGQATTLRQLLEVVRSSHLKAINSNFRSQKIPCREKNSQATSLPKRMFAARSSSLRTRMFHCWISGGAWYPQETLATISTSMSNISNSFHDGTSGAMLSRLLSFYEKHLTKPSGPSTPVEHLPDLTNFDGVLDIMVICNLFEFSDLLNAFTKMFKTTSENGAEVPVLDAYRSVRLRAKARRLVRWVFMNHSFSFEAVKASDSEMGAESEDEDGDKEKGSRTLTGQAALENIYNVFLVQQAYALEEYAFRAEDHRGSDARDDRQDGSYVRPDEFQDAMQLHFNGSELENFYLSFRLVNRTLSWNGPIPVVMRLPQFTEGEIADHSIDGLTPTDAQYGLDLSSFTSRDNNSLEDNNNDTSKTSQKRRKTRASTSKHNRDSEDSDYDAPKPS
ncbi:hypothetical protein DXG01_009896, partial [Tephrocybe rancida]